MPILGFGLRQRLKYHTQDQIYGSIKMFEYCVIIDIVDVFYSVAQFIK